MRAELALVGFGNVARRFVRLLEDRRSWLLANCDLECRIVAIATRRHGVTFQADGLDGPALATSVEQGSALREFHDSVATRRATSFDAIRLLAELPPPLRVVIETTTLDI